jgi:hypothetical protein
MNILDEIALLWWNKINTELLNPKSEQSINALREVLEIDLELDEDFVEYVIETLSPTETDTPGEDDTDERAKADADIEKSALTAYERDRLKNEAISDKLLKTKLTNPTTGNPNQVSTLLAKKNTDRDAYNVAKQFLGDKGVSDDEIENIENSTATDTDTRSRQINGYVGDKNKSLKQGDPTKTKEFNRELTPDDTKFEHKNSSYKNPIPPEPYKMPDSVFNNPKFPKKYITALERMMNTQPKGSATKWQHYSDIPGGAGQISAQAGELMIMVGASMNDAEFKEFTDSLLSYEKSLIEKNPKLTPEANRIITKSWITAAIQSREAIKGRIRAQYGEGAEILATAWDTEDDVTALGLSDYSKNKGFSTDMYMKVKMEDGTEILDEISLKKSTLVNFLNSGAGSFERWYPDLPDSINQSVYREHARNRNINFITDNIDKVKSFINSDNGKSIRNLMDKKGVSLEQAISGNSRTKQNILFSTIKEMAKAGDKTAISVVEDDINRHNEFVKNSIDSIVNIPEMKEGMLNDIRNEFPLKAISDGEETMAIGPFSLDKSTMELIFGTSDYNKLKENLVAEPPKPIIDKKTGKPKLDANGEPKMSAPFIGYKIGSSGEIFAVADIKVREDGRGYGGQFKFEMTLNQKSFAKKLKEAHNAVYKK